jgi:predicted small lipoprotein YifL
MKKILSLVLLAVLMVTLAACGEDSPVKIDDILDCISNPDTEECQDLIPDENDDRAAKEILADTIVENWDGDLSHIIALLDALEVSDAMEVETEFSFSVMEDGENHYIHVVMIDNTVDSEDGMILHRTLNLDFDGEEILIETIFQEVETGVHVFINFAPLREMLIEEGDDEAVDVFNTLGVTEDWLLFKFDDSLANMVEIEVMKDIVVSAFFEEYGETFFYDLQDELDMELTINPLADYGINIGMFCDYLVDGDYEDAEMMLDGINHEELVLDLDMSYLVPELVIVLEDYKTELDEALFDTDAQILSLQELGTEAWLNSLTEDQIMTLVEVLVDSESMEGDVQLSELLEQYYDGTLDHFLVMEFLNDPDIAYELSMIPSFDSVSFTNVMDNLDYDAWYLETFSVEEVLNAVYEGQDAFDAYILDLSLTAPQSAAIFSEFSEMVAELQVFMYVVDDIEYAFDNLSMFEEFFTLDYYMDNDILTMEVEKTEDFAILTTITLEPIAYAFVLQDVIQTTVTYIEGFESMELPYIQFINCPAGATCEPLPEYTELMMNLGLLGEVEYTVLYDPSNPTEVITKLDLTDFINKMAMMDEYVTSEPVIELSFGMTIRQGEAITIPTDVSDMNIVAEDFAKFSLAILAYEALEDVTEYYFENPSEMLMFGDTRQLDTFEGSLDLSLAFDSNMSYVEMGGSIVAPDYSIQLYWHDGTPVFTGPVGYLELLDVVGDEAPTAEMYQYYVDKVDEENFNMTKLLFVYIFNETDTYYEEPIAFPEPK